VSVPLFTAYVSFGLRSISKWVEALRSFPLVTILGVFTPDNTPDVGTFYDFIDRLWQTDKKVVRYVGRLKGGHVGVKRHLWSALGS
jgi:hypothetical protein